MHLFVSKLFKELKNGNGQDVFFRTDQSAKLGTTFT